MNNGYYPYSVGIANNAILHDLDTSSQMNNYKEEEKNQKAPSILPHEMSNAIALLGDTFTSLVKLRQSLHAASQNKEINQAVVDNISRKIDMINEMLLDLPLDLSIIKL
jgi:hypothetical protein